MIVRCPQCGSAATHPTRSIVMTSAGVGAIGGIAAVFAKTFSKGVPTSGIHFAASLLTNTLFSGLAGSLPGARVGVEIERSAPQAYSCNKCNHCF